MLMLGIQVADMCPLFSCVRYSDAKVKNWKFTGLFIRENISD